MENPQDIAADVQDGMEISESKNEVLIPHGYGTPLKNIKYISVCLDSTSPDHDSLKAFHKLLFNTLGHKKTRKNDIGEFYGFPFQIGSAEYSSYIKKLEGKSFSNLLLSDICILLGISVNGDKKQVAKAILDFLCCPAPSENANNIILHRNLSNPTMPERKRSSRHKESGPNHEKRIMNAYMRYANDKRDEIKAQNPNFSVTEIGRLMGKLWKEMSDEEKAPYVNAYNAEREQQRIKKLETVEKPE